MKVRNGFVSNSSSSSFIVIVKSYKKISNNMLMKLFDLNENSILYGFASELSDWMLEHLKEMTIKDIFNNYCYSEDKNLSEEDMIDIIINESYPVVAKEDLEKIKNKEYHYYECSASDDSGDGLESYLCEKGINVDNDDIFIQSGGSY
jgi:hypothetical protein